MKSCNFIILISIFSANDFIKNKIFFCPRWSKQWNQNLQGNYSFIREILYCRGWRYGDCYFERWRLSSRFEFIGNLKQAKIRWSKHSFESIQMKLIFSPVPPKITWFSGFCRKYIRASKIWIFWLFWGLITLSFLPFFNLFLNRSWTFPSKVILVLSPIF